MNYSLVRKKEFSNDRIDVKPEEITHLCQKVGWLSILSHIIKEPSTVRQLVSKTGICEVVIYDVTKMLHEQDLIRIETTKKKSESMMGNPTMMLFRSRITRLNLCVDQFGIFAEYVLEQKIKRTDYIRVEPKEMKNL